MKMNKKGIVYTRRFSGDWNESVPKLLDSAGMAGEIKGHKRVLIKPNLVEALHPPITTPVELIEGIVAYIQKKSPNTEIIVGDGTGSLDYDTWHVFDKLGYSDMAERKGIKLSDLNEEPYVELSNPELKRWPKMHIPKIAMESYLISVPVLKAHSLAVVTLSMKNLMGVCPPEHYCKGGHWKKSSFHQGMQEAILDLNRYRKPDFSIIDATVGMAEYHLGGPTCDPPPNLLIAGYDPVAVDAYGCGVLGKKWQDVEHIRMADGELGRAEALNVVES